MHVIDLRIEVDSAASEEEAASQLVDVRMLKEVRGCRLVVGLTNKPNYLLTTSKVVDDGCGGYGGE